MRAFMIVKTVAELRDFASEHDGVCKVAMTAHGAMAVEPDRELTGRASKWDYYMSDEPDCFDFDGYGITQ